jgi:hypothetical protein
MDPLSKRLINALVISSIALIKVKVFFTKDLTRIEKPQSYPEKN